MESSSRQLVVVFAWWFLDRSSLGFDFRVTGANPSAARASGISAKTVIVAGLSDLGRPRRSRRHRPSSEHDALHRRRISDWQRRHRIHGDHRGTARAKPSDGNCLGVAALRGTGRRRSHHAGVHRHSSGPRDGHPIGHRPLRRDAGVGEGDLPVAQGRGQHGAAGHDGVGIVSVIEDETAATKLSHVQNRRTRVIAVHHGRRRDLHGLRLRVRERRHGAVVSSRSTPSTGHTHLGSSVLSRCLMRWTDIVLGLIMIALGMEVYHPSTPARRDGAFRSRRHPLLVRAVCSGPLAHPGPSPISLQSISRRSCGKFGGRDGARSSVRSRA